MQAFRDFFEEMNTHFQSSQAPPTRKPINAEVIQVTEEVAYLDPVTETAEIQRMINSHNLACHNPSLGRNRPSSGPMRIRKTVIYTGYLISQRDSARIINETLNPILPNGLAESNDLKYMANNILIAPRPASKSVMDQAGGMGRKLRWQITGTGVYANRVFAARVEPVPRGEKYHSENPIPLIVLAVRKGARPVEASKIQNWQPVPPNMALTFDTVIGEKAILRIDSDAKPQPSRSHVSKTRPHQEGPQQNGIHGYEMQSQGFHPYQRPSGQSDETPRRGSGRGRGRANGRGRGSRGGRGRGGRGGHNPGNPYYRSLDDANHFDGSNENRSSNQDGIPMDY